MCIRDSTILDASESNLQQGLANGFSFDVYEAAALERTLDRACDTYGHHRDKWNQLVLTGMQQDWSWAESARKYVELYQTTIDRANATVCA